MNWEPGKIIIKKYKLKGWKAQAVDLGSDLFLAALLYFVIAPLILGANPPAAIVQTCSMQGTLNVGDVTILHGIKLADISAPEIVLDSPLYYTIEPNDVREKTAALVFPDGQRLPVTTDGDVIVYNSPNTGMQIVHRAIARVKASDGLFIITMGDANNYPDSVRLSCAETINGVCTKLSPAPGGVCNPEDRFGCLGSPVTQDMLVGRQFIVVPLIGHVKMLFMHIITLGHGYPGPFWC